MDRERKGLLDSFKAFSTGGIIGVHVTEVLHRAGTRSNDPMFDLPRKRETYGLLGKDKFKVV